MTDQADEPLTLNQAIQFAEAIADFIEQQTALTEQLARLHDMLQDQTPLAREHWDAFRPKLLNHIGGLMQGMQEINTGSLAMLRKCLDQAKAAKG